MGKKISSKDSREKPVAAYEKTKDLANVAIIFGVAQKRKTGSLALQTHKRGLNLKVLLLCLKK